VAERRLDLIWDDVNHKWECTDCMSLMDGAAVAIEWKRLYVEDKTPVTPPPPPPNWEWKNQDSIEKAREKQAEGERRHPNPWAEEDAKRAREALPIPHALTEEEIDRLLNEGKIKEWTPPFPGAKPPPDSFEAPRKIGRERQQSQDGNG
jgi:hypothetical protein